ncbi:glycosyltransferase family 39 protein [Candidatus Kaiserbacteria bacterium]|nr:glycosyltransferase family 39 protein [Candidatus Kaiserbacteria bacterium]
MYSTLASYRVPLVLCVLIALSHMALLALLVHTYRVNGVDFKERIYSQDSGQYIRLGESLLAGNGFVRYAGEEPETFRTPGYPAFLAFVLALTGKSFWAIFFVQALLAAAISFLSYLIARSCELSNRSARSILIFVGLSPSMILITVTGMGGDVLFTLLLTLATFLVLSKPISIGRTLCTGAILGMAVLVRPIGLYMIPLFGIALTMRSLETEKLRSAVVRGVVFLCAAVLLIAPWMIRNYVVAGHFALSSVPAFNMAYYNLPFFLAEKHGTSVDRARMAVLLPFESVPYEQLYTFAYADQLADRASDVLNREGVISYATFHLKKTISFVVGSGYNVLRSILSDGIGAASSWPMWPITLERLVWIALFASACVSPFFARGHMRIFLLLCVTVIALNAVLTSPLGQPRYRLPVEPLICIAAAYTFTHAIRLRSFIQKPVIAD